jgi:hypothetical protein
MLLRVQMPMLAKEEMIQKFSLLFPLRTFQANIDVAFDPNKLSSFGCRPLRCPRGKCLTDSADRLLLEPEG